MILLYGLYYSIFLFLLKWSYNVKILVYFEKNIAYFVGFGFLFSLISYTFSYGISDGVDWFLLSDGVYYLCFLLLILVSTNSEPPVISKISNFEELKKNILK